MLSGTILFFFDIILMNVICLTFLIYEKGVKNKNVKYFGV